MCRICIVICLIDEHSMFNIAFFLFQLWALSNPYSGFLCTAVLANYYIQARKILVRATLHIKRWIWTTVGMGSQQNIRCWCEISPCLLLLHFLASLTLIAFLALTFSFLFKLQVAMMYQKMVAGDNSLIVTDVSSKEECKSRPCGLNTVNLLKVIKYLLYFLLS